MQIMTIKTVSSPFRDPRCKRYAPSDPGNRSGDRGSLTGLARNTVAKELAQIEPVADQEITGMNGKTYKPKPADYFPVEGPLPGEAEVTTADLQILAHPRF